MQMLRHTLRQQRPSISSIKMRLRLRNQKRHPSPIKKNRLRLSRKLNGTIHGLVARKEPDSLQSLIENSARRCDFQATKCLTRLSPATMTRITMKNQMALGSQNRTKIDKIRIARKLVIPGAHQRLKMREEIWIGKFAIVSSKSSRTLNRMIPRR